MKKFKSLFLVAAALVFGLSSCNNDDVVIETGSSYVAITLGGAETRNAATGDTELRATGDVSLSSTLVHRAFVITAAGTVQHTQLLAANNTAQVLQDGGTPIEVALNSGIYVVANIPAGYDVTLEGLTTLTAINDFTSLITSQDNYEYVVLANLNAVPVLVSTGNEVAGVREVTVAINPVISRIELWGVRASTGYVAGIDPTNPLREGRIVGFELTGIILDGTHSEFRYRGSFAGTRRTVGVDAGNTQFNDVALAPVRIIDTFIPTAVGNYLQVLPTGGASHAWAFNFAAGYASVPRLVLRFEDIDWVDCDGNPHTIAGPRFITVTGYSLTQGGAPIPYFVRGNIHTISAANFTIDLRHLQTEVINPDDVEVSVIINTVDWNFVPTFPIF